MKFFLALFLLLSSFFTLAEEKKVLFFLKPPIPRKLSEWGIFFKHGQFVELHSEVVPYDLVNPLFSDYALKFRTLWIPPGKKIKYKANHSLIFPVGTVLTKTFSYRRDQINKDKLKQKIFAGILERFNQEYLIETRILVKTEKKWYSLPYVWNTEQKDADLAIIGKSFQINLENDEIGAKEFIYEVPNMNQCVSCHQELKDYKKVFQPIGVKFAKHLNKESFFRKGTNQLIFLQEKGLIEGLPDISKIPKIVSWQDSGANISQRARSYLDINCAHCHNPKGSANTSGLFLNFENRDKTSYGFCKQPVAAGKGASGGRYDISPGVPLDSVLYLRMKSIDPGSMMPELGRHLNDTKGLELIYQWIFSSKDNNQSCPP